MTNTIGSIQQKRPIRFMRVRDLPAVELYQGIEVTRPTSRHMHFIFALTVGEAGIGIHQTPKKKFHITPGNIIIINCGETHSNDIPVNNKYSSRTIRIEPQYLKTLLSQISGRHDLICTPQPVFYDKGLAQSILHLHSILAKSTMKLEKECLILDTLAELYARHAPTERTHQSAGSEYVSIRQVCEYLHDCYYMNISLNELAQIASLSPYYLTRVFTKQLGVSPHEYQLQIRLKKATDLLFLGKTPAEVAFETGFCDQSHFYKAFKKKYGITPSQYER